MVMTRERISFTIDPRDMLLSLHIGFSFVRFALAYAALERTPGLDDCSYILEACGRSVLACIKMNSHT